MPALNVIIGSSEPPFDPEIRLKWRVSKKGVVGFAGIKMRQKWIRMMVNGGENGSKYGKNGLELGKNGLELG